jgi:hypothetical protein
MILPPQIEKYMTREDSLSRSEWQDLELTRIGWHTQVAGALWPEKSGAPPRPIGCFVLGFMQETE